MGEEFGQRLGLLRKKSGHTQESLGAAVGVSRQSIWYLEKGQREPSHDLLQRLALALEVQPEDLVKTGAPRRAESFEDRKAHQQLQTILDSGGEKARTIRSVLAAFHAQVVTAERPKKKVASH